MRFKNVVLGYSRYQTQLSRPLRWGGGCRPWGAPRIQAISAGMYEANPVGPVSLRLTGVRAPPSGPATGKASLWGPRFRPILLTTPYFSGDSDPPVRCCAPTHSGSWAHASAICERCRSQWRLLASLVVTGQLGHRSVECDMEVGIPNKARFT